MKPRFVIYALILAAAVLAIVLFRPRQNQSPTGGEAATRETAAKPTPPSSNPAAASQGARHGQAPPAAAG